MLSKSLEDQKLLVTRTVCNCAVCNKHVQTDRKL